MRYETLAKDDIIRRLMRPGGQSVPEVAAETGIPRATLYGWQRRKRNGTMSKSRRPGKLQEKLTLLFEADQVKEMELGEWLRAQGLTEATLNQWREQVTVAIKNVDEADPRAAERELLDLKKEIRRKDKALAEMSALVVLKKKLSWFLEGKEEP